MRGSQVDRVARESANKKASKSGDASPSTPSSAEPPLFAVALQGALEYALPPTQDYWERARLVARIDGLREKIIGSTRADNSPYEASIEAPRIAVRDPEAVRGELLTRWVAKRKQFAHEAKSADLAVAIDACRPPADIVVRALSLEEVELTLPIDCARPTASGQGERSSSAFVVAK